MKPIIPILLHEWADKTPVEIMCELAPRERYEAPPSTEDVALNPKFNKYEILLASYDLDGYEGDAFVLLRDYDGLLYEVNGSHCSCHGLEDSWDPEPVTIAQLRHRMTEGNLGKGRYGQFHKELGQLLDWLEQEPERMDKFASSWRELHGLSQCVQDI